MTIEQRLERLERQNRWMKRIGALGLAVAAAVLLSGQAKGKDLQDLKARSLTLIDANGKNRVVLADSLTLIDPYGRNRVVLADYGLRVLDINGKTRATLFARGDGSSSLDLYDRNGKMLMALRALRDGLPSLALWDKNGKQGVALRMLGDGSSRLLLYDTNGKKRAALRAFADGSPSLILRDKSGTARAELGVTRTVNPRTGAETTTAENTLTMYDAKGDMIWQEPR